MSKNKGKNDKRLFTNPMFSFDNFFVNKNTHSLFISNILVCMRHMPYKSNFLPVCIMSFFSNGGH